MGMSYVFVGEGQQGGYSKSTLSSINAQVARYAHQQRRILTKSHSAPSSVRSLGQSDDGQYNPSSEDGDELNRHTRRSSAPPVVNTKHRRTLNGTKHYYSQAEFVKAGAKGSVQRTRSLDSVTYKSEGDSEQTDEIIAAAINLIFQQICQIPEPVAFRPYSQDLDASERRLFHYWCRDILYGDFGMALQPGTFQGQLIKYETFCVPLFWSISRAADDLCRRGNLSTVAACRSKEKALRRLREVLSDANITTDEAVGSILQSLVNTKGDRKIHLLGMDAMIANRGGLENVVRSCQVTCSDHIFLMYTFAPYDIIQSSELEKLLPSFFNTLTGMQNRFNELRQTGLYLKTWAATIDLADLATGGDNLTEWTYVELQKRIFAPDTAIGQLLHKEYNRDIGTEADFQLKARPFGALFQLNAILFELGTTANRTLFLRHLYRAVSKCSTTCDDTGKPKVMAGAFMFTVGHVCREIQQDLGFGTHDELGMRVARSGIAALKLFGLMLESMREKLYTYLQYWILEPEMSSLTTSSVSTNQGSLTPPSKCSQNLPNLTEDDMQSLSIMIKQLWVQKQRRQSTSNEGELYSASLMQD